MIVKKNYRVATSCATSYSACGLRSLSCSNINFPCSADHERALLVTLPGRSISHAAKSDDNNAQSLTTICSPVVLLLLFLTFSVLVANPKKLLYTWSANEHVGSIRHNLLRCTDPVLCKLSCVSGWEPCSVLASYEQADIHRIYVLGRCWGPGLAIYSTNTPHSFLLRTLGEQKTARFCTNPLLPEVCYVD